MSAARFIAPIVLVGSLSLFSCAAPSGSGPTSANSPSQKADQTTTQAKPEDFGVVKEAVSKLVTDTSAREYILCHLQPAFWGAYDMEVGVAGDYTTDKKGHVLRVNNGRFTNELDPAASSITVSRKRIVLLKSQEEAFAKGVAFYVSDVIFEPPNLLRYTVTSNPTVSVKRALARIQSVSLGSGGYTSNIEIVDRPSPFSSSPQPQKRTMRGGIGKEDVLSIVTLTGNQDRCLCSNEVPLESLAGSAKPK